MRRQVFNEDHEAFRDVIRAFIDAEVVPVYPEWEQEGRVPREFLTRLAGLGVFGIQVPEEYGGAGESSYKFQAVLAEETARAAVTLGSTNVHAGLVLPYLLAHATAEQKQRWLPGFVTGEIMTAIAMSEPGTGSDLAGVQTTAIRSPEGDHYILNGAKTFITGGAIADRVLVVCRTSAPDPADRRAGLSILVVDAASPGYAVGRKLDKIGLATSDTVELSFTDVRVPVQDRLGEEGAAFSYLSRNLAQERLGIAVASYAQAAAAVRFATAYTRERVVFGRSVAAFQNTKFALADCIAEVGAMQAVVDRALEAHDRGEFTAPDAAAAKLFCTETAPRVIDRCLQLHGGYGYIREYPIARLYEDNRVHRIYGGTSEMMRSIVFKDAAAAPD